MTRKSTIEKTAAEITALLEKAYSMRDNAEREYNFVPEKIDNAADKLEEKAEKLKNKLVAKLVASGLCSSLDGLSSSDADNPIFADVPNLFDIGDGSWC